VEKRSIETTPEDPSVAARGWEGLRVWWLVGRDETAADSIVFNVTEFAPRKEHELHRHPNAEEALYVLRGAGLHLSTGEPVRQQAGEVIFIERGEWHGFANDTDEPTVVIAVFGGVGSYEDAGYETLAESAG
jgi:quercetin dioxygenase-like cupin family protein